MLALRLYDRNPSIRRSPVRREDSLGLWRFTGDWRSGSTDNLVASAFGVESLELFLVPCEQSGAMLGIRICGVEDWSRILRFEAMVTHRPLSSSLWGLPYKILNRPQKRTT